MTEKKTRDPEYQRFLDLVNGRVVDELPSDQETVASEKEIGWRKQFQIRRALYNARYHIATPVELHLLWIHRVPLPSRAKERTERVVRKRGEDIPVRLRNEKESLLFS